MPDSTLIHATDIADLVLAETAGVTSKSEVTLFKLGRYRHPKSGVWNITADFLEAVLANFEASGRRPLPIDEDHAPERGGSTAAYGWITDLKRVGDELRGSIEWTAEGAAAIRSKRFQFFSPSWSFAGHDETGAKVGGKLLGAGLTNRPFFPWTEIPLADDPAMLAAAVDQGIDADHADLFAAVCRLHPDATADELITIAHDLQHRWWTPLATTFESRPAEFEGPTSTSAPSVPGLDADGERLYADVLAYAAEHALCFDEAFGQVSQGGGRTARTVSVDPDLDEVLSATTPEAALIAGVEGINELDAYVIAQIDERIAEARRETGASATPWLDTSKPLKPVPWNDDHFERDRRRADSVGLNLDKDTWQAAAEAGEDVVYEHASEQRERKLVALVDQRAAEVTRARTVEGERRRELIESELDERARRRLGKS